MEFRENLISLRKSRGWSQEELGYRLNVSRQTVSKWESGDTTPEMGKLVALGRIFGIGIDALVSGESYSGPAVRLPGSLSFEYRSERTLWGLPLVHINIGRGFRQARGVIAVGNIAVGFAALGAISAGVLSIGILSAGILALGALAGGVFSGGAFAAGYIAAGGIAAGYLAMGGVAMGTYAMGGVSLARNIAVGGVAQGYIAIGESVKGTIEFAAGNGLPAPHMEKVRAAIDIAFPSIPHWLRALFTFA